MGDAGHHCSRCDATGDAPAGGMPLAWSTAVDADGEPELLCGSCTRTHLRSIEARLDEAWWDGAEPGDR